ncbi:hypothetical protein HC928_20570 [bacterium]|nr:hypothetical protein [bacterium]
MPKLDLRALALLLAIILLGSAINPVRVEAQQTIIDFTTSQLNGENLTNPTSLQFGPDGRLYVSQQNGTIYAYTIERAEANVYNITNTETINLVKNFIPNHDDDGTPNPESKRQVTGIYVAGTGVQPVLYVGSSDSRIGAGGEKGDVDLDTNSSVISRLTCVGGLGPSGSCNSWDKVDLVRGLPRSEENHSINGLALDADDNILYVALGGATNAGAPSNNFASTTEYAYEAAILSVDLTAIAALPVQQDTTVYPGYTYKWVLDLPTLDDPTRPNANGIDNPSDPGYDGIDVNDPFGGNDGLNQAKVTLGSPVQIHSPGWRNVYDLILTYPDGPGTEPRMYAVDNGANPGWGGTPLARQTTPGKQPLGCVPMNSP